MPTPTPLNADLDLDLTTITDPDEAAQLQRRHQEYLRPFGVGPFYARNPRATLPGTCLAPWQVLAHARSVVAATDAARQGTP